MMTLNRFIISLLFVSVCGYLLGVHFDLTPPDAKFYCIGFTIGFVGGKIQGD